MPCHGVPINEHGGSASMVSHNIRKDAVWKGGIFHTYQLFLYLFVSNSFERGIFIAEAIFTVAVNILYFSKTIQKMIKNDWKLTSTLEKMRIFVDNIFCIVMSVRKERCMKGYLSIRETSYKWGISERLVNQYVAQGRIPMKRSLPSSWVMLRKNPHSAQRLKSPKMTL